MGGVKIMELGFYHPRVGYWQAINNPSSDTRKAYPKGTIEVALKPSHLHTFDGSKWTSPTQEELDAELAAGVRTVREDLLKDVDAVAGNSLRWGELAEETRDKWATYRTDLLDVPQQPNFPNEVTWPTKP